MSTKIKQKDLPAYRKALWEQQGKRCALSGYTISLAVAVVDHDHKTGHIRGVLHRGVNSLLGKIENNYRRYGLTIPIVRALAPSLAEYITKDYSHMPIYPTHKTEDEKRERRNALARKRRAAAKEAK